MSRDRDMTPDEFVECGQFTPIGEGQLFWFEAGGHQGGELPVLFLHGIPTWSWLWRNVLPETGRSTRSIAVDLPGFGMSDSPSDDGYRVEQMAETLKRFLDEAIGRGEPVALVAHDFGSLVAAELIARSPERYPRLVILNTSFRNGSWSGGGPLRILSVPGLGQVSMWLSRPWMLRQAMNLFLVDDDALGDEQFAGYWYPFEHRFGQNLARMFQHQVTEPVDFDRWRDTLRGYRGDSLVMWGGRDPAFTLGDFEDIRSLLPDCESMVFENASHFLPEERPRAVGRRIRAFLAGME